MESLGKIVADPMPQRRSYNFGEVVMNAQKQGKLKQLSINEPFLPRKSDATEFSKRLDSVEASRRTSFKDDRIIGYLHSQKDSQMPNLRTYIPNKNELNQFNDLRNRHNGTFNNSSKERVFLEAAKEKELLGRLQDLRKDNNQKRSMIEDLTNQLTKFTDSVNTKRHGLTTVREEYQR